MVELPRDLERTRVVEIGHHDIFLKARPEQSFLLWTHRIARPDSERCVDFSLREFFRLRGRIARGEVDLVVVYTEQYAPWHWRTLRGLLRRPPRPLGMFIRNLGVLLVRWLPRSVPLIAIDHADSRTIARHNHFLLDRSRYYFKRELPTDRWQVFEGTAYRGTVPSTRFRRRPGNRRRIERLRPHSLGCSVHSIPPAEIPFPEKTIDVFAAMTLFSSSVRSAGLAELKALQDEGVRVFMPDDRLPPAEFYARMAQAWLTWSPEGFGWECFRHYEAPLHLSVPVINMPTIVRQNPLREGEHALYYRPDEAGDLARTIRAALADHARIRRIAEAARRHVHAHHLWPWRHAEALLRYGLGVEDAPGGVRLD